MRQKINTLLFGVIICIMGGGYFISFPLAQPISRTGVDEYFADGIPHQEEWIQTYGWVQRVLGKRAIENFTLFKNNYGKIVCPRSEKSSGEIAAKAQEVMPIFGYLEERGIPYYYMTSLLPIADEQDLPMGVEDDSGENADALLGELQSAGISVFDLRKQSEITAIDKEHLFYKTDHHWSMQGCFAAFQAIIRRMERDYAWELDAEKWADLQNYHEYIVKEGFLGSYGVKLGKHYSPKEDFDVYLPDGENEFLFQAYNQNHELIQEKEGDFSNALMDWTLLEDADYNNKYNAFLNTSSVESRILNESAGNDKRLLLIAHSYGRPLAQYLGLCFGEVRMLDPQEGRFEGDYLQYIEEYQPDMVLFLIEFEGEIIGNYRVE